MHEPEILLKCYTSSSVDSSVTATQASLYYSSNDIEHKCEICVLARRRVDSPTDIFPRVFLFDFDVVEAQIYECHVSGLIGIQLGDWRDENEI
jgi:hypothetical protein